jgi:hypothetical protein
MGAQVGPGEEAAAGAEEALAVWERPAEVMEATAPMDEMVSMDRRGEAAASL